MEQKLYEFTPKGTSRDQVYAFLKRNLKRSADVRLEDPAPKFIKTDAASMIFTELWTRYVFVGQYHTHAWFFFDEQRRLDHIWVFTADVFL